MNKKSSKAKTKRLPGVGSNEFFPEPDSHQVVIVGGSIIPVLGVANCTDKSMPEAQATARRIEAFLSANARTHDGKNHQ